jgi:hypothetical protein
VPRVAKPNDKARRHGVEDKRAGTRERAGLWPPGTCGHADYELGRYWGEPRYGSAETNKFPAQGSLFEGGR